MFLNFNKGILPRRTERVNCIFSIKNANDCVIDNATNLISMKPTEILVEIDNKGMVMITGKELSVKQYEGTQMTIMGTIDAFTLG